MTNTLLLLAFLLLSTVVEPSAAAAVISPSFSQVQNPFYIPARGFSFKAGSPTAIKWAPTTPDTVTLVLRKHIPNTGHYTWTPPTSITRGDNYTLQLINDKYPDQTSFTPYFLIDSDNLVATVTPVYTYGAPTRAPGEEGAQLLPTATVSPTGGEVVEEATATAAVGG